MKGALSPSEANAAFSAKRKTSVSREKTEVVDYQNQSRQHSLSSSYTFGVLSYLIRVHGEG